MRLSLHALVTLCALTYTVFASPAGAVEELSADELRELYPEAFDESGNMLEEFAEDTEDADADGDAEEYEEEDDDDEGKFEADDYDYDDNRDGGEYSVDGGSGGSGEDGEHGEDDDDEDDEGSGGGGGGGGYAEDADGDAEYEEDPEAAAAREHVDFPTLMARISIKKVLYTGKTDFQRAQILEAPFFGRILTLDGDLMMTERDHHHYHEMEMFPSFAYRPDAKRVLVIGGGDGGVALMALQSKTVTNVTVAELDGKVVDLCRKYLRTTARSFDSKRVHLKVGDGAKFVSSMCGDGATDEERYDIVVVDSTDTGVASVLSEEGFYRNVRDCALRGDNGILIRNFASLSWQTKEDIAESARNLTRVYDNTFMYQVFQPTYASGHYGIWFASKGIHPAKTPIDWDKVDALNLPARYWTPDVHYASFALPTFVRNAIPGPRFSLSDIPTRYPYSEKESSATSNSKAGSAGIHEDL